MARGGLETERQYSKTVPATLPQPRLALVEWWISPVGGVRKIPTIIDKRSSKFLHRAGRWHPGC